jgi:long-chain acyl-CoA synthetase
MPGVAHLTTPGTLVKAAGRRQTRGMTDYGPVLTADARPDHCDDPERPWLGWYAKLQLPDVTIHPDLVTMFRRAVATAPDKVAVDYYGWTATYADLDRLSRGFAAYLVDQGIERGDRIGIYLQTSPHFMVAALGVWRAGGVVVTMNPMYRSTEVGHLLTDSEAVGIVSSQAGYRDVVAAVKPAYTRILVTTSEIDVLTDPDPRVFGGVVEDPVPRHRRCAHGGPAVRRCPAARVHPGTRRARRALLHLGHHRAGKGRDAHPPQSRHRDRPPKPVAGHRAGHPDLRGSAAVPRRRTGAGLPAHAADRQHHLPHLSLRAARGPGAAAGAPALLLRRPPTMYTALMAEPTVSADHFASCHRIFAGGAVLPPAVVEEFERRFGRYINNGYGLTETAGACVFAIPNRPARVDEATQAMSNGIAHPGTDLRIVGEHGEILPVGERGEIQIRGDVVTPGYWRREEETAKAIVDGWFSSGDVGFFDDEHILYCADRSKT